MCSKKISHVAEQVWILGPLGYGPSTLPLRHSAIFFSMRSSLSELERTLFSTCTYVFFCNVIGKAKSEMEWGYLEMVYLVSIRD